MSDNDPSPVSTPEEAIEQLVKRGCVVNLCPHPIRVPVTWFLWIGDPEDYYPDVYEWISSNAQIVAKSRGGPKQWVTIPASGEIYRLKELDTPEDAAHMGDVYVEWMPESPMGTCAGLVSRRFDLGDIPVEKRGTVYIVSLPALMGLASAGIFRDDLIAPDTGRTCDRDDKGNIIGVRGFVRLAPP